MNLRKRLEDLEGRTIAARPSAEWSREKVAEKVVDELDFAHATTSPVYLCDAEFGAVGMDGVDDLPEWLRPRVRMRPWEDVRHRYGGSPERPFEGWRERARKHGERVEAYIRESKQRDRELLEDNRASVGLPPLTSGQVSESGLEGTSWGEGHR